MTPAERSAYLAGMEEAARVVESHPRYAKVMYDRPGSPPGNATVLITGREIIAAAIRARAQAIDPDTTPGRER